MKRRNLFALLAGSVLLMVSAGATQIIQSGRATRDPAPPPLDGGDTITTFTLTSTVGGANLPFMLGHEFAEGDVSSGLDVVSDTSDVVLRSVCKREWRDGSCKHAVFVGTSTLTANVAKAITLKTGTAAGGTALTCSDITSDAPSASVAITGVGTVDLSSLLASPFRTWISTPEMVECHYRSAVAGDADLAAWFHVRMWQNGTNWIRAFVENGYVNGSPTTETHTVTITIGGTQVLNSSVTQYAWTRYDATGWIGTDPDITPAHNVDYLINSKLVPNYSHRSPSSTALNGIDQAYTVMDPGPLPDSLGSGGFHEHIGIFPTWDALYITSGDARAWRGVHVAARSLGSYSLFRRSSSTNLPARPADFPTTTYASGGGCGGFNGDVDNGVYRWDVAHAPNEGFLAYLISGDYYHLETIEFTAQAYYFCHSSTAGSGVNRAMRGQQNRSVGWGYNIVGGLSAIAPMEGEAAADLSVTSNYRTWFANVVANHAGSVDDPGQNLIGLPYMYSTGAWDDTGTIAPWMTHFWIAANGRVLDMEALDSDTDMIVLSDFMFKFPVVLAGPTGSSNYHYSRAGRYGIFVDPTATGPSFGPDPEDFCDDGGCIWEGTHGSPNNESTNTLSDGNFPDCTSYWGNWLISIIAAVDHSATGASTAYGRVTGATNWSQFGTSSGDCSGGCSDVPNFCVVPR